MKKDSEEPNEVDHGNVEGDGHPPDMTSMLLLVARVGYKSMSKLVVHDLMPGQMERRLSRAQGCPPIPATQPRPG